MLQQTTRFSLPSRDLFGGVDVSSMDIPKAIVLRYPWTVVPVMVLGRGIAHVDRWARSAGIANALVPEQKSVMASTFHGLYNGVLG